MADKTIVTELVVDARGAAAGSAVYTKAMEAAQRAVDRTLDREEALKRAMQTTSPAMVAAAGSITRTAAAWDRLRSSLDPVAAAEIKAQRAIEQATIAADNAVKRGLTTEVQAADALQRLRMQQIVDLDKVRDAQQRLGQQAVATGEAVRAAANDNNKAGAHNTANVAAQFQDIFVTAQMGMNPLQIALQQGSQLSAVFGPLGAAGAVRSLGAAFVSLINPVSLITIGLVAAVAAVIQWGMSAVNSAHEATKSLEDHRKALGQLLEGYDAAGKAAADALEKASMLPQGVVISDLGASLKEQEDAARAFQTQLDAATASLNEQIQTMKAYQGVADQLGGATDTPWQGLVDQIDLIKQFGISASSTVPQLHDAMVAARELYNTTDNDIVREAANQAYSLAQNLLVVKNAAYAAEVALSRLNNGAALDKAIEAAGRFKTAMGEIAALTPELRSPDQIANDNLNVALGSGDALQRMAAQKAYDEGVSARAEMARREAEKKAAGSREQTPDQKFGTQVDSTRAQIEALELQNAMFGATTAEATKAATALDLVTAAQKAGLEVTPEVLENIDALAQRMADAKVQAEGLQTTLANQSPFEALRGELASLDEQLAMGAISWETYEQAKLRATAGTAANVIGSIGQITDVLAGAFEDNKALAVASAVINTAEGVTKALAQGGMFAWPMAAAIAAAGAVQVASIMSAKPGSGGVAGVSSGGSASAAAPTAPTARTVSVSLVGDMFSREAVGSLFERLNDELGVDGLQIVTTHKQA